MNKATPVLYLDIDGTVRHGKDELGFFVGKKEEVIVFPEAKELILKAKSEGFRIVGISNQGGIALGLANLHDIVEAFIETNRQCDYAFDKISFCQHHPNAKEPEYAICWCIKPRIGLILESALEMAKQFNEYYPPHLALFVGDRPEDRECAEGANIKFMDAKEWRLTANKVVRN